MVKVSVIVAVYNPGDNIDELLRSLDAQSLPPEEFEVIFIDDDSTDGSRDRLREWASTRPQVKVLHNTPNSGWPGRPRNIGIDAAEGEYIFFADNDDKFPPRALEWMYDYAAANNSDVLIPKEAGVGPARGVARAVFRKNLPDAKLGSDPILGILTPHKLVRTSMVREHDIRFPEGRVRLEDHYFMMKCLFAAKRISVLADRLCYYWMRREAGGENAAFSKTDPAVYYGSVAAVLEIIETNTEPGALRDKLYSHWYDTKMLVRLRGDRFGRKSAGDQEELVAALRTVADRFGLDERMLPYLGAGARARALLLMHGTVEDLRALCKVERATSQVELQDVSWTGDGRLSLSLRSEFVYSDERGPITLRRADGQVFWDVTQLASELPLKPIDVTDLDTRVQLNVLAIDRVTRDVRYLPVRSKWVTDTDSIAASADLVIDPAALFRGARADTVIDLYARLTGFGWMSEIRIPAPPSRPLPTDGPPAATVGRVSAYATKGFGNLSVRLNMPVTNPVIGADSLPEWQDLGGQISRRAAYDLRRATRRATTNLNRAKRWSMERRGE